MLEEIDYSEEPKFDLFESVQKQKINLATCVVSQTAPSYEKVNKILEKNEITISKKEYEKICKELGLIV
jgi:hypothetical protein